MCARIETFSAKSRRPLKRTKGKAAVLEQLAADVRAEIKRDAMMVASVMRCLVRLADCVWWITYGTTAPIVVPKSFHDTISEYRSEYAHKPVGVMPLLEIFQQPGVSPFMEFLLMAQHDNRPLEVFDSKAFVYRY